MLNFHCFFLIKVIIVFYFGLCEVDDLLPVPFQHLQLGDY